MSDAPTEIKECAQCGPRLRSQFRTRPGGRLNSRCRRCTKLNARHEAWLTARAEAASTV